MKPYIDLLLPMITSLLSGGSNSSSHESKKLCPAEELVSTFNVLCEGLDQMGNKKIRAICFMDRLNKFHKKLWEYSRTNSTSDSKGVFVSTALDLTAQNLRREITNVMKQLSK